MIDKYALSSIPTFSLCGRKSGCWSSLGLPKLQYVCIASYALKKCKSLTIEDAPRLQSLLLRGSESAAAFSQTTQITLKNVRKPNSCEIHPLCFSGNGKQVLSMLMSSASEVLTIDFIF